ncbi:PstS family phosphate ABC transporter substrate-binding protein [Nocardia rhizosphaerae]|uniref:PstS family phosphate ABC transporter substrate-binding protein n=1 Tax=Nocardia rhizosphaerae TaxID=1691571 RepID=A0ABV8L807_9NOCA
MGEFPVEIVLSVLGLIVAIATFLREYVFVGRKRLGYRVQMNTPARSWVSRENGSAAPASEAVASAVGAASNADPAQSNTDSPAQSQAAGEQAAGAAAPEPADRTTSLMLIRIENDGSTSIEDSDYQSTEVPVLAFRAHTIESVEVTERVTRGQESVAVSSAALLGVSRSVGPGGVDQIVLPAVPLDRGEHYKLLVVLVGPKPEPLDVDGKKVVSKEGWLKGGRFEETTSRSRREPALLGLSVLLALVVMAQLLAVVLRGDPPPRDCAASGLTIVGSTAMAPMIRAAAQDYEKTCTGARFAYDFTGTEPGLRTLAAAGPTQGVLAIGDGSTGTSFAMLTEIPLAVSSFAVITHPGVGLKDLSTQQVRDLYRGNIRNWNQIGGPDLPVVLIDRTAGSGTRRALESQLLEDNRKVFRYTSCIGMAAGGEQCEVDLTEEVATFVAKIAGAVGYLETSAVGAEVAAVSIDGVLPTPDTLRSGDYRFTGVEYAYTHGPIAGDSLIAQFLDYLIRGKARLTMMEFGNIPCVDPVEPNFCTP